MAERKVIVANYRYFVSGGPEVYLFKFMERCGDIGYAPIPFSVRYGRNKPTPYDRYFIGSRGGDSVYYHEIRRTPKAICKTLQGAFYNPETVKNLCRLIDEERPQVLYALQVINTLSPSIFKAAKERGLKVVHRVSDFNLVCPRSDLLSGEEPCRLCVGGDVRHAVKYADEIIVLSNSNKAYFRETYDRETKYIPNGVPPPELRAPDLIQKKYGLSSNGYVLFLARIVPEKGLHYLIPAWKSVVRETGTEKKLVIAGAPSHSDGYYREICAMAEGDESIVMTGYVEGRELQELYSNACLYVLPSDIEGMPIGFLEALSYGNVCLVSDIPENMELWSSSTRIVMCSAAGT